MRVFRTTYVVTTVVPAALQPAYPAGDSLETPHALRKIGHSPVSRRLAAPATRPALPENCMSCSNLRTPYNAARLSARALAGLAAACLLHSVGFAAALPAAPQTFDSSYAAPTGATLTVAAGGDLQGALNQAQLGDTIVLQSGATFTGPFKLPNKTAGSGWIYVVSSSLASLPPAGQRVGPTNAVNMPKILAPAFGNALVTVANSNHFRFVGIEFAPIAGAALYQVVTIGNGDTSPATLANHIVFDRCYVHGNPGVNDRRGIEMDGAYVAVVDSYISDFQEKGTDSQGIWAYNTSGPLQIVDNYIEAAGENVLFGGSDSREAALVPADIEIRNNYFFKPLSLMGSGFTTKNLLEFKAAQRVLATANLFQNNPLGAQDGFALLITPRNQGGTAPWSITADIAVTGNEFVNVGSGFNVLGEDNEHPSLPTARVLIRDNVVGVTGLNGASGRAFQAVGAGGSDYTIDHNTIIDTAAAPAASTVMMAQTATPKVTNLTFTNNLATRTAYGFFGSGVGQGTVALNANFSNWVFSKNVLVEAPAASYPTGNFFPTSLTAVGFANYAGGDYTLAANSPYKSAATDGTAIGANLSVATLSGTVVPEPPKNVAVK
jgi:hypothetical protein